MPDSLAFPRFKRTTAVHSLPQRNRKVLARPDVTESESSPKSEARSGRLTDIAIK